jgi:hypothetical protein
MRGSDAALIALKSGSDRWSRRTEPHALQGCVENLEVDADHYPGGDPQNGQ